jgi:hypothetical protein
LIDQVLATGTKSGYTFAAPGAGAIPRVAYTATANPVNPGQSGQRHFFTDQSGVIRYNAAAAATAADSPLQ